MAFTVMFWDKDNDSESPVPGEEVLSGIQRLYGDVTAAGGGITYPHGMKVRILLGVQFNTAGFDSFHPFTDLRFVVLEQLQNLDIPIYEALPNGSAWKVEVALYEFGRGSGCRQAFTAMSS
ncbi:MAG: hypothetical protein IPG44_12605 [Anaerolineales bacterium]|nr:hypothetical protein [Anaerolineales bacterium]